MEIAEIVLAVFTASGVTYGAVQSYRASHTPKLKRELPVGLWLRAEKSDCANRLPEGEGTRCVVLVFDNRGCLVRKFPQAECSYRKERYRIRCASTPGEYRFCVLFSTEPLHLSGVLRLEDARRLAATTPGTRVVETGVLSVASGKATYELHAVDNLLPQDAPADSGLKLDEVLPSEVVTDAMAKELIVDLHHYSHDWTPGSVGYDVGDDANSGTATDSEQWLAPRRRNRELILQLRTNFDTRERCAWVALHTADGTTHRLPVRQRVMGEHPTLTVSKRIHVSPGVKHEAVELTVTPDSDTSQWSIRRIETSDGGRWWTVQPGVGTPLTGAQTLRVHLEAKPANVASRSAVVTLETGTYPFNQTTDICLMQGICFDYYIEYPMNDPCTRHKDVIETPLDYRPGDAKKRYIVRVDSNQAWRLVKDETTDWVQVGEVQRLPGSHGGLFAVEVASNAENDVQGGFPAARHTMLSLINDTGVVKDIFIYQGGYVRIRGIRWLDRNLPLPEIAVPLGLSEEDKRRTWGSYYQFGKPTSEWKEGMSNSTQSWHSGTEETPGKRVDIDPSPPGWRVPSVLELSVLLHRQVAPMNDLLRGNGQDYLCLLSDDGVPFFLPLCGHLSHINGCRIGIPRGNRYWCGTSQSPIYGHSLCIEASRQMSLVHDMKKYGFPVRAVLEEIKTDKI